MPWKETNVVDQREAFVRDWMKRRDEMTALCERYGISRKTGYKWVRRFIDGGKAGLVDRSRRPHHIVHAVSDDVAQTVIELKKRFPRFGPRKLRTWLTTNEPDFHWPAASTIGELLKKHGLVTKRRRRRRTPRSTQPLSAPTEPNVVWGGDFKGCFRVAGSYCHPLTISDLYSRYFLRVQAMEGERHDPVKEVFESAFREYGLPLRIRTDNGSPFASRSVGGLSRLSVWWVKLGIIPERIDPGHPEQNGRHERLHRTLKEHTAKPPRPSLESQQDAFDNFQIHYNEERPHESLGQHTPASCYMPSTRPFPDRLEEPEYPGDFELRRVKPNGYVSWHANEVGLSQILKYETVGFEPISDGRWQLWFGPIYLGLFSEEGKGKYEFMRNDPK